MRVIPKATVTHCTAERHSVSQALLVFLRLGLTSFHRPRVERAAKRLFDVMLSGP